MVESNHVLIITYYWPPGSSPGVQRWLMLSKELVNLGLKVSVLTVKNGSFPATDPSLNEEIHPDIRVYRAMSIEPFRLYNLLRGKKGKSTEVGMGYLKNNSLLSKIANYIRANIFIPDARMGWVPYATKKALKVIDADQISAVITTGPPHSTHLVGKNIKNRLDVKWCVDLRDPWTSIYYNKLLKRSKKSKLKDINYEKDVITSSDEVFCVSDGMEREFSKYREDIRVVTNGYNERDFLTSPEKNKNFTLAYIGNLKSNQDIKAFWESLNFIYNTSSFSHFDFKVVGNVSEIIKTKINDFLWGKKVIIEPFKPHLEAVKEMQKSHLLYLPIPQEGNNKAIITGKIFEYLASKTPILAIGPTDGDAAKILHNCQRTPMFAYEDKIGIQRCIEETYQRWRQSPNEIRVENNLHEEYSRKRIAKSIIEYLKN